MEQKEIIGMLIERYNACQSNQYQVTRIPDEENRRTRDIDAYAECAEGSPLAVEHTKLESFRGQLQDAARFQEFYGELAADLKHTFSFDLMLSLPIFAFKKGTKWVGVRDSIRQWLLTNASALPDGYSSHQIDEVPFTVGVNKNITESGLFTVARRAPSDQDLRAELVQSFAAALSNKDSQLSKYRASGAHTILILESLDIALVSPVSLYKAFLQVQQYVSAPNVDEFWLACSYDPDHYCEIYCLSGPEQIMACANPQNFEWGPGYASEWDQALKEDQARLGEIDLKQHVPMLDR